MGPSGFKFHFLRSSESLLRPLHNPKGLTDSARDKGTAHKPHDSFTWGHTPGMAGPYLTGVYAGANHFTWYDANITNTCPDFSFRSGSGGTACSHALRAWACAAS